MSCAAQYMKSERTVLLFLLQWASWLFVVTSRLQKIKQNLLYKIGNIFRSVWLWRIYGWEIGGKEKQPFISSFQKGLFIVVMHVDLHLCAAVHLVALFLLK